MNDILIALKSESNLAFGKLYEKSFPKIASFVQNNSGSRTDAEDLFQEAMMVLVEKLRQDHFRLTASLDTYLYAICKNLWFKKIRGRYRELSLEMIQSNDFQDALDESIENEKTYLEKLKDYLLKISEHCYRLIQDIFFKHKAIDQIQEEYGYSSRHNAQNQKHKCVKQIRKIKEREENSKQL